MSIIELYERDVKNRPANERLQLAAMILKEIAPLTLPSEMDVNDEWTAADLEDFTKSGWQIIDSRLQAEESRG